jgi:hypothetical protein
MLSRAELSHGQSGKCCTSPHSLQFDQYFLDHVLWFILYTASFRFSVFKTLTNITCLYSVCSLQYMEVSFMPCVIFISYNSLVPVGYRIRGFELWVWSKWFVGWVAAMTLAIAFVYEPENILLCWHQSIQLNSITIQIQVMGAFSCVMSYLLVPTLHIWCLFC